MNELKKLGYTSKKIVTGAIEWTKDSIPMFLVCDWVRPVGETHEVIFYGDDVEIRVSQDLIIALADTLVKANKKRAKR